VLAFAFWFGWAKLVLSGYVDCLLIVAERFDSYRCRLKSQLTDYYSK
jgi:hypothetical protein